MEGQADGSTETPRSMRHLEAPEDVIPRGITVTLLEGYPKGKGWKERGPTKDGRKIHGEKGNK
jgi:hypothetical protein